MDGRTKALESFLRHKLEQLGRWEVYGFPQEELLNRLFASDIIFGRNERDMLLNALSTVHEDIKARLESMIRKAEGNQNPYISILIENKQVEKKKIVTSEGGPVNVRGDSYELSGSNASVGAFGHKASGTVNVWRNMGQVATELGILHSELASRASGPDQRSAAHEVELAMIAARSQDKNVVMEHLRRAGAWAFEVAQQIGSSVAVAAIGAAIGIP
ncbi:hypothetical protein [Streptomyces sp. NPDC000618]|uniref:hypothetical protein n=1 Tax=Streptomyces sp. NPDC000618 TaxID=3154265 RepID=UPI0033242EAA